MKELDEVGFAGLSKLIAQYQAFMYTFQHSPLTDPAFRGGIESADDEGEILKDFDMLMSSFDMVLETEDSVLDTGWVIKQMEEELNSE
jgi:hypothetical protein